MTHSEFKALAHAMGADVIFQTSPTATFVTSRYTLSLDVTPDELEDITPLEMADILAEIGAMLDKPLRSTP